MHPYGGVARVEGSTDPFGTTRQRIPPKKAKKALVTSTGFEKKREQAAAGIKHGEKYCCAQPCRTTPGVCNDSGHQSVSRVSQSRGSYSRSLLKSYFFVSSVVTSDLREG